MSDEEYLKKQNELLKVLVRLLLDERLESTEEKAKLLAEYDFTQEEVGNILNRDRTTISKHL